MSASDSARARVVIVDYGVGNLGSVGRAFARLEVEHVLTSDSETIERARLLVLPGVGHFGASMTNLRARDLEAPIRAALSSGARLLGICVGFQMLFDESEEAPGVAGLGLIAGKVKRFPEGEGLLVPHIGWNQLEAITVAGNGLLRGVAELDFFYFLHSYYVVPTTRSHAWATTEYGLSFTSVAGDDAVSGIQFHPEKSQELGLRVLGNFLASRS